MRERATEGWPEGHPGGEGNRSGDCQRQPLWGEKSGSERVNIGSGNERVKGHGEHGGQGTVRGRFFTGAAIECLIVGVESNSALWDVIWRQ